MAPKRRDSTPLTARHYPYERRYRRDTFRGACRILTTKLFIVRAGSYGQFGEESRRLGRFSEILGENSPRIDRRLKLDRSILKPKSKSEPGLPAWGRCQVGFPSFYCQTV